MKRCIGAGERMKRATILRGESSNQGTFGKIISGSLSLYTLELPWHNDESNISDIQKGLYVCRYTLSPRLRKYTYEVFGDNKRSGIRIHSANLASQLLGCIALGQKIGTMDGVKAVFLSRPAVTQFEQFMQRQIFQLEVK